MPGPADHLTGVDERVELIVGDAHVTVFADVLEFSVDDEVDDISYKPLGRSGTVRSQDHLGHTGVVTVVDSASVVERAHQAVIAARVSRTPLPITLVHVMRHKTGEIVTHTYTECQLTWGRQVTRGEVTRVTINFATGNPRLES